MYVTQKEGLAEGVDNQSISGRNILEVVDFIYYSRLGGKMTWFICLNAIAIILPIALHLSSYFQSSLLLLEAGQDPCRVAEGQRVPSCNDAIVSSEKAWRT